MNPVIIIPAYNPDEKSIKLWGIIKYSLSSLASTLIDLLTFTLLIHFAFSALSTGILVSTIIARLISGNANFILNKHWVFKSKDKSQKEGIKYFSLFITQMISSGVLVTIFSILPIPTLIIKIFVDTSLFLVSYQIQKRYIFNIKHTRSVSCR